MYKTRLQGEDLRVYKRKYLIIYKKLKKKKFIYS